MAYTMLLWGDAEYDLTDTKIMAVSLLGLGGWSSQNSYPEKNAATLFLIFLFALQETYDLLIFHWELSNGYSRQKNIF